MPLRKAHPLGCDIRVVSDSSGARCDLPAPQGDSLLVLNYYMIPSPLGLPALFVVLGKGNSVKRPRLTLIENLTHEIAQHKYLLWAITIT